MVKVNKNLLKEILIKVNIKMVDLTVLEHINGRMVLYMRVCLKMVLDMVRANGLQIKRNISVIIAKVLKRVTESYIFIVVIFTKETLLQIEDKDMDKCFGLMDLFIKDNGKMVFKMGRDKSIYLEIKL